MIWKKLVLVLVLETFLTSAFAETVERNESIKVITHLIKSSGEESCKSGNKSYSTVTACTANSDTNKILLSDEAFNVLFRVGLRKEK